VKSFDHAKINVIVLNSKLGNIQPSAAVRNHFSITLPSINQSINQ